MKRFVMFQGSRIFGENDNMGRLLYGGLRPGSHLGDRETGLVMDWGTGQWMKPEYRHIPGVDEYKGR